MKSSLRDFFYIFYILALQFESGNFDESKIILGITSISNICENFKACSFYFEVTLWSQNCPQRPNLWTFCHF